MYRASKGKGSKETGTGAWGCEEQVRSRSKGRERRGQGGRRGKTTGCLEKLMGSLKADGKGFVGITQMEWSENCWLSRETAHLGAESDMGAANAASQAGGLRVRGNDRGEVIV